MFGTIEEIIRYKKNDLKDEIKDLRAEIKEIKESIMSDRK
jgi:hypothetical protein